jgi:hypothetical protein
MKHEETGEQLWDTVLPFDVLRERLLQTCFNMEVTPLADPRCGLRGFVEEMQKLVARYDTLLAGLEAQEAA